MKRLASLIIFCALSSCSSSWDYDPGKLTPTQKDELMSMIIRYLAKPPENVPEAEKFDSKHDGYYQQKAAEARLEQYYKWGDTQFFLISQRAPSLTEKRHATGGRFTLNESGELASYEEAFRTWKMVPDTLQRRSFLLFDKMVRGESLEPYLTINSQGIEYIEFPDERTFYHTAARAWKTK